MAYVEKRYPESPFISYRPYESWASRQESWTKENKFYAALARVSSSLVRGGRSFSSDPGMYDFAKPVIQPIDSLAILDFSMSEGWTAFLNDAGCDNARDFEAVRQIVHEDTFFGTTNEDQAVRLTHVLPSLWGLDGGVLDPRRRLAEQAFSTYGYDVPRDVLLHSSYIEAAACWMNQSVNAAWSVGLLFLLSRFAPISGLSWRESLMTVKRMAKPCDGDIPESIRFQIKYVPIKNDVMGCFPGETAKQQAKRLNLMIRHAKRLHEDFQAIVSGDWARTIVARCERERPAVVRQPQVALAGNVVR